jgi:hypothetical protein
MALKIFALLIVLASASLMLFPAEGLAYAREMVVNHGIWWAAGARLILAALLWFSAPVSRTPVTLRVFAGLVLAGATFLVAVGSEGVLEMADWLMSWPLWGIRLESVVGVAFGVFVFWSVTTRHADV